MIRVIIGLALGLSTHAFADAKTIEKKVTTTTTQTASPQEAPAQNMACVAAQGEAAYRVTGMTCSSCEASVSKQFGARPEVAKATADHKTGCLTITWKPGKSMSTAQVSEQLKKVGYDLAKTSAPNETQSH